MKRLGWLVLLFLEVCMAGTSVGDAGERRKPAPPAEIMDTAAPLVTVVADPEYLVGFPMVVAVTLTNTTEGTTWSDLPGFDLLSVTVPVQFTFVGPDGRRSELPTRSLRVGEGPPDGITLAPGQAWTMLFDISELTPPLTPGAYTLESLYRTRHGAYPAAPVPVTISAPSLEDGVAAGRLRAAQNAPDPSWSRFLDNGRADLPEVELSPEGWRALAFHEAVHRAVYGHQALKAIDPALFDGFKTGPLAGAAALIRLELWRARDDARAGRLTEKLLAQWPGLRWRVQEIEAGRGWLASLRRTVGAEKS